MRWIMEVAYIGVASSWKWLLGSTAVVAALVGLLFSIGVIGGGGEDAVSYPPGVAVAPTPTPTPTAVANPQPTAVVPATATPEPIVAPVAKFITVPILATRAENVGSLEFVLVFDPAKVESAQIERGLLSGDALIDFSSHASGRLWTGIVDTNGITGSGPVALVRFKLRDDVGGSMPLSLENIAAFDANTLVDIVTATTPGEFNLSEASPLSPIVTFR